MARPSIRVRSLIAGAFVLAASARADADNPQVGASADIPQGRAFNAARDARFGLLVSWGLHSLVGRDEHVMDRDRLPVSEYEKLPPRLQGGAYDPAAWVRAAKAAGLTSIAVVAKNHDGFCLFETALTRFDSIDASPFGKDPLKPLAEACRKEGIALWIVYSLADWHHPDALPPGKTGRQAGRAGPGNLASYNDYYQGQIRELCTNYGPIAGVWLVGAWDRPEADWDLAETHRIVRELQPDALIGDDRHAPPPQGDDPSMRLRLSVGSENLDVDVRFLGGKPVSEVVAAMVDAAGRDANLLMGVRARADGSLAPGDLERLTELGKWLSTHGSSLVGTRGGPVPPAAWGASTRAPRDGAIYLHILKPDAGPIVLPPGLMASEVRPMGQPEATRIIARTRPGGGVEVDIPLALRKPIDTIFVVSPIIFDDQRPIPREP
ncbi:alpha-L-fucosidase [Isosphaeraceae bacterium EP7]